jgi:Family of unknown function (DUF6069)
MTTYTTSTAFPPTETPTALRWRTGARAGVVAAVATTAVAAVALAVDVPLEVDGEQIPLAGFAQMTLLCTAIGLVLAKALGRWAAAPRRTFTTATVVLTALSLAPDVAVSATTATKLVLVTTHLVAAAILIPPLAGRLPDRRRP